MAEEKLKTAGGLGDKAMAEETPPAPKPKKPKAVPNNAEATAPQKEIPKAVARTVPQKTAEPFRRLVRGGGAVL